MPTAPDALTDRQQDATEPLLAIADALSGPWPALAREAVVSLCTVERLDSSETLRLRLLADLKAILGSDRQKTTEAILADLIALPEAPWSSYYGRTFGARDLAMMLKHYGVRSKNVRQGTTVGKGYSADILRDVFDRYL